MEQATAKKIQEALDRNVTELVDWRRHMHQHPELSFKEEQTARFIEEQLRSFGLEVQTNVGGHGIVAKLKGKHPGKTIAFRADFDALPIDDEKEVPYKSKKPGVMHACGHDGHTAALLWTAKALSGFTDRIHGTILFIFQPAEELPPGGAKYMVEEGIMADVDYVFGAHLDSQSPLGTMVVGEGYQMAAVDKFTIRIQGVGGHGARPHQAVDALVIACDVVNSLQKIVSRQVDPLQSAVVTVGVLQAGSAFNIIADKAVIEGTVRTFDASVRQQVEDRIRQIAEQVTAAFGATCEIDYLNGYPALYNHPAETQTVRSLFGEEFGEKNVADMEPSMGAEDFSYFLLEKPGTYFRAGSQTEDPATHYPHHHPKFDFDERALESIGRAFVKIAGHYVM